MPRYARELYQPSLTLFGGYFEMLESGKTKTKTKILILFILDLYPVHHLNVNI